MKNRPLGTTKLSTAPLIFGSNVFGWTVDEATSFQLLDRFEDAGLNTIDTADTYSTWAPGNKGGESEIIIGKWLKRSPGRREKMNIITKVGGEMTPEKKGLSGDYIMEAVEASLKRLQIECIDVYISHWPDADTPYEETLRAYEKLIEQGKVKAIGSSNLDAAQLREALDVAQQNGLPRYEIHQPEYNLYSRDTYDGELRDLCIKEGLGTITYYSLASGFLTGKYRSEDDLHKSQRGHGIKQYLNPRGMRILDALDAVAAEHDAQPAEVALAWLMSREGVTAPIASATSIEQLNSLIRSTRLSLSGTDMKTLNAASAPGVSE